MAKIANPLAKITVKLVALQAKSAKLSDEITALLKIVTEESKKTTTLPKSSKVPAKVSAKTTANPKVKNPTTGKKTLTKKVTKRKPTSSDYLSMLNEN